MSLCMSQHDNHSSLLTEEQAGVETPCQFTKHRITVLTGSPSPEPLLLDFAQVIPFPSEFGQNHQMQRFGWDLLEQPDSNLPPQQLPYSRVHRKALGQV